MTHCFNTSWMLTDGRVLTTSALSVRLFLTLPFSAEFLKLHLEKANPYEEKTFHHAVTKHKNYHDISNDYITL